MACGHIHGRRMGTRSSDIRPSLLGFLVGFACYTAVTVAQAVYPSLDLVPVLGWGPYLAAMAAIRGLPAGYLAARHPRSQGLRSSAMTSLPWLGLCLWLLITEYPRQDQIATSSFVAVADVGFAIIGGLLAKRWRRH